VITWGPSPPQATHPQIEWPGNTSLKEWTKKDKENKRGERDK